LHSKVAKKIKNVFQYLDIENEESFCFETIFFVSFFHLEMKFLEVKYLEKRKIQERQNSDLTKSKEKIEKNVPLYTPSSSSYQSSYETETQNLKKLVLNGLLINAIVIYVLTSLT
jgi:hypothetical protein